MQFPGLIGNADTKSAIAAAFSSGRFPHAIVLQGESGTGKRSFARLIAQALVCRNPEIAPCGTCPSCVRAMAGSHPDIRVIEGSGKSRAISVDAVRALTADAYRKPEEALCSVYLLFIENQITEIVQNKLLKLIEEPPENTIFILTCSSAELLLPTIRSRVQIYTLRPPSVTEAAAFFAGEAGTLVAGALPPSDAQRLSALCGGNIGLMQQELGGGAAETAKALAAKLSGLLMEPGEHQLLAAAAPLYKDRQLLDEVLQRLHLIFRDACVLRAGSEILLSTARAEAQKLGALSMKRLTALEAVPEAYRRKLRHNANMTLLVTALCAQMREIVGR